MAAFILKLLPTSIISIVYHEGTLASIKSIVTFFFVSFLELFFIIIVAVVCGAVQL